MTLNLPVSEWYASSDRNDLQYWGLDYPRRDSVRQASIGNPTLMWRARSGRVSRETLVTIESSHARRRLSRRAFQYTIVTTLDRKRDLGSFFQKKYRALSFRA